jgi:hypothetical protein
MTLDASLHLTEWLHAQGKHAAAEQIEREILSVQRRVLGEEHLETLTTSGNLATSLCIQGRYAEAEQIQRKALDGCKQGLGEGHPYTLEMVDNLVHIFNAQGKHTQAKQIIWDSNWEVLAVILSESPFRRAASSLASRFRPKGPLLALLLAVFVFTHYVPEFFSSAEQNSGT